MGCHTHSQLLLKLSVIIWLVVIFGSLIKAGGCSGRFSSLSVNFFRNTPPPLRSPMKFSLIQIHFYTITLFVVFTQSSKQFEMGVYVGKEDRLWTSRLLGFARGHPKISHRVVGPMFALVENRCSSEIFAAVIYFCKIYVRTSIIVSFLKHLFVSWLV